MKVQATILCIYFWHALRILGNNEIETVTLAGNHQFRYLTGKHKMLNVTIKCQQTRAANVTVTADVQN